MKTNKYIQKVDILNGFGLLVVFLMLIFSQMGLVNQRKEINREECVEYTFPSFLAESGHSIDFECPTGANLGKIFLGILFVLTLIGEGFIIGVIVIYFKRGFQ